MKVLFAGPTLFGLDADLEGIVLRPPAAQGDVLAATIEGATVIGIIDGLYEQVAAVWHKEILFALSRGVRVLGGASMGALRAAECVSFGMEPVGAIAAGFISGEIDDDAAVAITHAPAELGYAPLTEALVDVAATVDQLVRLELVRSSEAALLTGHAAGIFFRDRTIEEMFRSCPGLSTVRLGTIERNYHTHHRSQKQIDAALLIRTLKADLGSSPTNAAGWTMNRSAMWVDTVSAECGEDRKSWLSARAVSQA